MLRHPSCYASFLTSQLPPPAPCPCNANPPCWGAAVSAAASASWQGAQDVLLPLQKVRLKS